MDPATNAYYDHNAPELCRRYDAAPEGVAELGREAFAGRTTVLDVGCGSGRDVRRLLKSGFDARGVDASAGMIDQARATARAEGVDENRFTVSSLPALDGLADETFDAVLCCAVLMHIPDEHLFDAVYGLRRVLRPGGRLLVSIPERRPDIDPATSRDPEGRLFSPLVPDKLSLLIERIGFRPVWRKTSPDSLDRPGHAWVSMLFEKLAANADRPLDQVESVLNRDKKDATYKLALFRALAEIAQTQYNTARHTHDHRVKIPIEAIALKWLAYYWPLVSSETFIAQKFGEREDGGMPIAIRKPLAALIHSFPAGGGWPAFLIALKNNRLTDPQKRCYGKAISTLKSTIWNMPVRHAGGGDFSVFAYDRADQTVLMPVDLWRELVLTGSWIQDATVLRWAELTAKLSDGRVGVSLVVEKLLSITDPERETRDARTLYLNRGVTECVWSGQPIRSAFDVDHAIPFALWHNNDLWNLFPARPEVNNAKRDQLPAQKLVQHRRDALVGCWELLHAAFPDRFLREAAGLFGGSIPAGNWQAPLFSRFSEAIEITATQRSVPRWDPGTASRSVVRASRQASAGVASNAPTPPAPPFGVRELDPAFPGRFSNRSASAEKPNGILGKRGRVQEPSPKAVSRNRPVIRPGQDTPNPRSPPLPAPRSPLPALTSDLRPLTSDHRLPLIGNLAAGPASSGFDITNLDHAAECPWVPVPESLCGKNRYVVRIAGDSMEPELHVGDLVVFEYHRTPRAENQIVVANLPALGITSDGTTLDAVKRLLPDPHDWLFRSTNPAYPDLRIPKRDCAYPILGVMVGRQ